jgi:glycosyltransferase involved in cell wall biosynthesis
MGFAATNHSWAIVAQNICRALKELGHEVHIFSTNGVKHFPDDLKPNLRGYVEEGQTQLYGNLLDDQYDMQLSYTAFKNFDKYFLRGNKNRFGIWNYETDILPPAFAKMTKYVDKVLPSSNFSKYIFTKNGVPEDHQIVIPHGIRLDKFIRGNKFPLKTNKRLKILANIAQPHIRKNIPGLLSAYGKAFTKQDDVCLILKISRQTKNSPFEVDFQKLFSNFRDKYKNHADVEIIDTFIIDIEDLYNACDVVFTMTHAECFWMPGLEGFAANKIVVAPRYGGQLDYMNDDNSFLVDGKYCRAPIQMQYWSSSPYARMFDPSTDHASEILKNIYKNYDELLNKFSPNIKKILPDYTWESIAKKILSLCK